MSTAVRNAGCLPINVLVKVIIGTKFLFVHAFQVLAEVVCPGPELVFSGTISQATDETMPPNAEIRMNAFLVSVEIIRSAKTFCSGTTWNKASKWLAVSQHMFACMG